MSLVQKTTQETMVETPIVEAPAVETKAPPVDLHSPVLEPVKSSSTENSLRDGSRSVLPNPAILQLKVRNRSRKAFFDSADWAMFRVQLSLSEPLPHPQLFSD